jgi:hypothetical protein
VPTGSRLFDIKVANVDYIVVIDRRKIRGNKQGKHRYEYPKSEKNVIYCGFGLYDKLLKPYQHEIDYGAQVTIKFVSLEIISKRTNSFSYDYKKQQHFDFNLLYRDDNLFESFHESMSEDEGFGDGIHKLAELE